MYVRGRLRKTYRLVEPQSVEEETRSFPKSSEDAASAARRYPTGNYMYLLKISQAVK